MSDDEIPPITDPLGKYWTQPDRTRILVDHEHAVMTHETLHSLADYSASTPTGVYPGKMWRRREKYDANCNDWFLAWYGHSEKGPDFCSLHFRRVLLV
jgi:hypothetical protein